MYTDPIADFLTRIRNAGSAGHKSVEMPSSRLKSELARVLLEEGYIKSYEQGDSPQGGFQTLRTNLKYDTNGYSVIRRIRRVSKPGLRKYAKVLNIPRVLNGAGVCIVTTNRGVMTDRAARRQNVSGEILCTVE